MGKVKDSKHSVSERMGLHAAVRLASEAIAYYYPMTTFVHHNPLHGFEDMSFEDALKKGKDLFGAEGYLPEETYIDYLRCGRIKAEHLHQSLREAIERKGLSGYMKIGGKEITPFDVLKASFEHKVSEGAPAVEAGLSGRLFEHLAEAIEPYDVNEELERIVNNDVKGLGREMTISAWCDNVLKDDDEGITHKIDIELIKWCEAFLDEGHADWAMPGKDKGMYDAWRYVASKEISHHGIKDVAEKLKQLPAKAEDCMAECLSSLGVTEDMVQDYIRRHLVFLPGWAGYIKWREDQEEHAWQQRYPAHLVDLMAIRLWYEKEFASIVCREKLGTDANIDQITEYMKGSSLDYFFRCEKSSALVPSFFSDEVDRIIFSGSNANTYWEELREGYFAKASSLRTRERLESYVKNTLILTESVGIAAEELLNSSAKDIIGAVEWMTSLDDSERGLVWLKAFEETYRESLIGKLKVNVSARDKVASDKRSATQSVFCIDVRSEPFRRHLESTGDNETYGFAGFFGAFISYRALGSSHETEQIPVIVSPKNKVREVPRQDQGKVILKHRSRSKLRKAGYTLLYDLKGDIITPYVMVESFGWFYFIPILGKTWVTGLYAKVSRWFRKLWMPHVRTSVTVDRPTKEEAYEMLSFNQSIIIRRALVEKFKGRGLNVSDEFVEHLRLRAMDKEAEPCKSKFTEYELNDFVKELRENYRINPRWASASMGRIMQLGFTIEEQVFTVESALRAMGLTKNFARIVLLCGHGSTTENNPFEAALDCGACGGNSGHPNARVVAAMANKAEVREGLKEKSIVIPDDTYFVPGRHDTTTDEITIYDFRDLPESHREDLERFKADLLRAGKLTSRERCERLPDINKSLEPDKAWKIVKRKSADWSQVRPEWGLSGNTSFVVGRRYLTKDTDLSGRVFLHSYDHIVDKDYSSLEAIMIAPQVVTQWINMEHYFSTVDNDNYGSGSKIYHNVTCRNAIMYGSHSDIRAGLPLQTVMAGDKPFHEPVRLTTIIEAPKDAIQGIIDGHPMLQNFYDKEWVFLVSVDPESGEFNRYVANKGWEPC